jgi:two-component system, LuxR family, sensor histidine kinase TtrS
MTKRFFQSHRLIAVNLAGLAALALALYALQHSSREQIELVRQSLVQEAQAHFDNLLVMRRWNAMHGGVYIKQHGDMQANPYLPDNQMLNADGEILIKINPAWMTRQLAELANVQGRSYYHITSLKPINPGNIADAFEQRALTRFEQMPQQKYYYEFSDDNQLHFIGALTTEEPCLACHTQQGYELGDVRGGIRVSLPLDLYHAQVALIKSRTYGTMALVLLLALSSGYLLYRFLQLNHQRQQELADNNELLAIKVAYGTREVTNLLMREKYLRGILRTVADVNELLISAHDEEELLRAVCLRIAAHQPYCAASLHFLSAKGGRRYTANADGVCQIEGGLALAAQAQATLAANQWQCARTAPCVQRIFLPLKVLGVNLGVLEVDSAHNEGFEQEEIAMLSELAADLAFAVRALRQSHTVQRMEQERVANYEETILSFVNMIEFRDTYTAGHTSRVAEYCGWIAEALDYSQADRERLQRAAILHDIGKIATPDSILLKPERLNDLEYRLIQEHAIAGYEMLAKINMYRELAVIVRHHHERYDGRGYPDALTGDAIPPLARIIAVADAFDAMTTNRIYKSRKSIAAALNELEQLSGSQFDPTVIAAAVPVLRARAVEPETSQLPQSELERIRFAYFFYDQLTGLFNEHYLMILLQNEEPAQLCCIHALNMRGFSIYNRAQGWAAGDALLKLIADTLRCHCPDSALFRVKGDYFIVLSHPHIELEIARIKQDAAFPEQSLALEHYHCDISGEAAYQNIKRMLHEKGMRKAC